MAISVKSFKGGVHPPEKKELSANSSIEVMPPPKVVRIPLQQHLGAPTNPIVKPGSTVKKGEKIGEPTGFVSSPVHSSVSGKVLEIIPVPNIFGAEVPAVVIENDFNETWADGVNVERDINAMSTEEIKSAVKECGLVGMGGATFPTHVKISPPPNKPIDTFIANGVECEPYLTSDYRLMLEKPDEILEGVKLLARAVNAKRIVVAIEANKPDAVKLMRERVASKNLNFEVIQLKVKYPQGAEKQLIKALTGREVPPPPGLPMDVGCLVQNVGTCYAAYQACKSNIPLIERVVTVTGEGVETPKNLLCRIGTPLKELLALCRIKPSARKLILGGPMMGLAQWTDEVPVIKGTSGVLVLEEVETPEQGPCIRCGRCVDVCIIGLVPSAISIAGEAQDWDTAERENVLDCIECGCCTYVCPAKRQIVQYVKQAKAVIMPRKAAEAKKKAEEEKKKAEEASKKQ
ncbi:MAG: electron transport complex subunit RsxC [Planctomycetota bacterium]|nr:electron transport complex subunit RsxC [Planctomycetota bacterium]